MSNLYRQNHPHAQSIPDVNDRTPNDPAVLIESKHVQGYYLNANGGSADPTNRRDALLLYRREAELAGWDVQVLGNSLLLRVTVQVEQTTAVCDDTSVEVILSKDLDLRREFIVSPSAETFHRICQSLGALFVSHGVQVAQRILREDQGQPYVTDFRIITQGQREAALSGLDQVDSAVRYNRNGMVEVEAIIDCSPGNWTEGQSTGSYFEESVQLRRVRYAVMGDNDRLQALDKWMIEFIGASPRK